MSASMLTQEVQRQDLMLRKMFADAIVEEEFLAHVENDGSLFNETLELAANRNWLKPTQLAEELKGSDSNTRKWFKTDPESRSTPNVPTRVSAFKKASELIKAEALRIERELNECDVQTPVVLASAPRVAALGN